MAISLVQSNKALTNAGTNSQAVTWANNTTTGNAIIVTAGSVVFPNSVTSVTDSQLNTYVKAVSQKNGDPIIEIWYALNITGGTLPTVTVHFSSSSGRPGAMIREYSGLATSLALDQTAGANVPSSTTSWSTGASGSTVSNNELIVVAAVANDNSHSWSLGSGFGNLQTQVASSTGNFATEDKIVATTGSQTGLLTASSGMVGGIIALATFSDTPISLNQTGLPSSISSTATLGSVTATSGAVSRSVTSIASGLLLSSVTPSSRTTVTPSSITSTLAQGLATSKATINRITSGISSATTIGSVLASFGQVLITSVVSTLSFGAVTTTGGKVTTYRLLNPIHRRLGAHRQFGVRGVLKSPRH